jgi:diguanylate cyclase (GGDEF)-like protein
MVIRKSRRKWGEKLHIQKDEKQTMLLENELEKHYRGLADELTGLPNRTYFERRLKSQWLRAKEEQLSFAVMILSIDGLKYINDILGYQLGEQLIIEIARELKTVLGKENFICRFSGNQFAAIIEGINLDKYENIAQNIIRLFSSPFKVDRYELDVSINIGLSVCLPDEQDSDALIDKAYIALLLAKKEGKNTYNLSSPDINIKYDKEFGLRHDLCKAIEKEQFKVYYQPLVNLKTNEILAAEALVRWEHPHWGMISPNEFIYLAEETGFIISMGDWILREVCQNYKHWLDNGLPSIKVSINFSSIQFFADDFVKNIVNTINGLYPICRTHSS